MGLVQSLLGPLVVLAAVLWNRATPSRQANGRPFSQLTADDFKHPLVFHVWDDAWTDEFMDKGRAAVEMTPADEDGFRRVFNDGLPLALQPGPDATAYGTALEFPNMFAVLFLREGAKHYEWALRVQIWLAVHVIQYGLPYMPEMVDCLEQLKDYKSTELDPKLMLPRARLLSRCFGDLFKGMRADKF